MKIKSRDVIICGLAMFAIFFGAGNLIFPPYLGVVGGDKWYIAGLAFLISDPFFTILGVYATIKLGGRAEDLGKRLNPTFAKILEAIAIILIGPLFSVPRTGATTHEIFVLSFFPSAPQWISSLIFFSITAYVALNPNKVMDTIGKYLTPVLLAILATVFVAAIIKAPAPARPAAVNNLFAYSFREGYQTMDALGAALMAGIVAGDLRRRGYKDEKSMVKSSLMAGGIAFVLLALVYIALTYCGSTVSTFFDAKSDRTLIFTVMIEKILGRPGQLAMGLTVAFACLTTAIGLTSVCGHFFSDISGGTLSYKSVVLTSVIIEFIISLIGVNAIIKIAFPVLTAIYPIIMFLILSSIWDKKIKYSATYLGGVIGAGFIGGLQALALFAKYIGLKKVAGLAAWTYKLPLASLGLEWLLPAILFSSIMSLWTRAGTDRLQSL